MHCHARLFACIPTIQCIRQAKCDPVSKCKHSFMHVPLSLRDSASDGQQIFGVYVVRHAHWINGRLALSYFYRSSICVGPFELTIFLTNVKITELNNTRQMVSLGYFNISPTVGTFSEIFLLLFLFRPSRRPQHQRHLLW